MFISQLPLWLPLLVGGTASSWRSCGRQRRCWRTSLHRGSRGHYRCLLWRQTQPYQYRQTTEHRAGLTLTNSPESVRSSPVPSLHPVPEMLSCSCTSWELLLQHSLSSVNSSLPSMLIVCWSPVMPEVWNGPGDTKAAAVSKTVWVVIWQYNTYICIMHRSNFFSPDIHSDSWALGIGRYWVPIQYQCLINQ